MPALHACLPLIFRAGENGSAGGEGAHASSILSREFLESRFNLVELAGALNEILRALPGPAKRNKAGAGQGEGKQGRGGPGAPKPLRRKKARNARAPPNRGLEMQGKRA